MNSLNEKCPVSTTLKIIGGKYKALVLWHCSHETLRFSQIRRLIPEATAKMLTQQLRELEKDKLIIRKVYPVVPPKVEYSISDKGKSLYSILEAMYNWGEQELSDEGLCPKCSMKK
ncbi:MAG: winged helix-turn-helix transcriptional regulator [Anaerorhabdus sp.]